MSPVAITLLVIVIVLAIIIAVLYFLGKKAQKKGVTEVVFDRGGNLYHGRIQAVADGAREAGLKF